MTTERKSTRRSGATLPESGAALRKRLAQAELWLALDSGIAQVGHWVLDLATQKLEASAQCKRNFGRDPAQPFDYAALREAIHPDDRDRQAAAVLAAVEARSEFRVEYRLYTPAGELRWASIRGRYDESSGSPRLIGVSFDITEHKRAEKVLRKDRKRQTFLLQLADDLSRRTEPEEIMQAVGARLGGWLDLDACLFVDVDEPRGEVTVHHGWNADGMPNFRQTLRLADYLTDEFALTNRAGETVAVGDTASDPRMDGPACAEMKIGAFVTVPFQREGRWVAYLAIIARQPRDWQADEIELFREIADRVFPRIERARAETALRASEEKFAALFASAPAPFLIIKPDAPRFTIAEVNDAYLAATLRTREEVIGRAMFQAFPDNPDDSAATGVRNLRASFERALAYRRPDVMPVQKYDIARPDGRFEQRWWSPVNSPVLGETGEVEAIIHHVSDVTEQYRAETALRASEERYRSLFNTIDEGYCIVEVVLDEKGAAVDLITRAANRVWHEKTGLPEGIGKRMSELTPKLEEHWLDYYESVIRTGQPHREENYMREVDRWFTAHYSLVGELGSNLVAVVFDDITARKRAELALRESEERKTFLLKFSDALRAEPDADAVAYRALEMLLNHLQLDRCYITYYRPADDKADFPYQIGNDTVPPLPATVRLSDFPDAYERVREATFVMDDDFERRGLSEAERASSKALGMRAMLASTVRRGENNPLCSLVAVSSRPRHWSPAEIALVEEAAERTWNAIEHARVETAMRESEARLAKELEDARVLQEISNQLVSEAAPNGHYKHIVEAARALMRSDAASIQELDAADSRLKSLAHTGFHPASAAFWARVDADAGSSCRLALAAGKRVVVPDMEKFETGPHEIAAYRKSGIMSVQSTPLVASSGRIVGMLSTHWNHPHTPSAESYRFFDILARVAADFMERARAEAALRSSEAKLQQAARAKDEFIAMLSHELRNPLAPITTTLQLMKLRAPDAFVRERGIIEAQAQYLTGLVDDLLDVTRIARGKIGLKTAPVEIAEIVAAAVETAQPLMEDRRQSLHVEVARGLVVRGDTPRLVQVVVNLLGNAAKYSPPGHDIRVTGVREGAWVVLRVNDDGDGIESALLPRIFEMFTQDAQPIDRSRGGLGLGLAIVRSLVELHGGKVEAASDGRDRGSEFTVRLPLLEGAPAQPLETAIIRAAARAAKPVKGRVLIVDDYAVAAESLGLLLQEMGYQTHIEHDGAAGLQAIEDFRPDVALVDIGLPVMDGYELARSIRNSADGARHLPLVAITGYGQASDHARIMDAGFDEHLVKPLRAGEVGPLIEKLLAI